MNELVVNIENVSKYYGAFESRVKVLKNVDFSVKESDYVAIMGPSGSGKSTLMNIIGCLDKPTSGYYSCLGKDVTKMTEEELSDFRLNNIGFVFQNFNLLPTESALENVALPLVYAGVSKKVREEKAIQMLDLVGLKDRLFFKPSQLSGGQKQRVAIARALINDPNIILADEPTGALDQNSGKQIMHLFKELNHNGKTIVMITHDINVAKNAKRILYIVDGKISEKL
ncbi:ABC transporter ATP-binding protein [Faecalitalea cylindroides]|uniref:ABC transporter ATP-binding protein n=1 Tax=Faecalitalea cylindroides TaxID=39483 RepID=UPI0022E88370|nr:ABC transporter ATP-binding protein [Faecalitalea cylindroides]